MDIFLTGSTGFVGGHLYKKLLSLGHTIHTDVKQFDYRPYDCVIHLSAVTHIRSDFDPILFEKNIVLANKIMTTPYRLLYASSCSAAHLTNPYAYTKRYAEWIGTKHPNSLGFRFHNIYGPGNGKGIVWFLSNKKDGDRITIRGPYLIRDYIHVDDVVNYIVRNLRGYKLPDEPTPKYQATGDLVKNTGVRDVGTGVPTTTIELVSMYEKISGKKFLIETEPPGINEPIGMVSNNVVPHMSLEEGLKKIINS